MTNEQHLLTILAEECAEVAHRASKAIRFGMDEIQSGQPLSNKARIEQELGDLLGVCDMLGLVPDEEFRAVKECVIEHYARLSMRRGLLEDPEAEPERVWCPKGCGLAYLPENADRHSCQDS